MRMSTIGGRSALCRLSKAPFVTQMIGIVRGPLVSRSDLSLEEGSTNARMQPGLHEVVTDPSLHPLAHPRVGGLILDEAVRQLKLAAVTFDRKANVGAEADRTELEFGVRYFECKHFRTTRNAPEKSDAINRKMPI